VNRITIRISRTHPLCRDYEAGRLKRLQRGGQAFISRWDTGSSHAVAVATVRRTIVGFFRYDVQAWHGETELLAAGTWVAPQFRRRGIASALWWRALSVVRPTRVGVVAATVSGVRFLRAFASSSRVQRAFPALRWLIDDSWVRHKEVAP